MFDPSTLVSLTSLTRCLERQIQYEFLDFGFAIRKQIQQGIQGILVKLYRQLTLEDVEHGHQHVVVGLDSSSVFLADIEQTIENWEAFLKGV
jgi:hypothetical protein